MNLEITKRIKFCAGHRLVGHGGKCENLHGHNYVVDVTVTAGDTDAIGRVVDFADLKAWFKGWIDENWDHGCILAEHDVATIDSIRGLGSRVFVLPANPTAENMATYLLETAGPAILAQHSATHVELVRVTVWETDDSSATVLRPAHAANENPEWLDSSLANGH